MNQYLLYMISGFCCDVEENRILLGYYAQSSGNSTSVLWDNLTVPTPRTNRVVPNQWLRNYHYLLHNNPEHHSSQYLLDSICTVITIFSTIYPHSTE
jgi:hypothetical protein